MKIINKWLSALRCCFSIGGVFLGLSTIAQVETCHEARRDTTEFGSLQDSIGVVIKRVKLEEKANDCYEVKVVNLRSDPVCVMHSTHGFLLAGTPPLHLALFKNTDSSEVFSLGWLDEDTRIDDNYPNHNFNAEPILPFQTITFKVIFPDHLPDKQLIFEYIVLPDLCYKEFKRAIYKNAATWYDGRDRRKFVLDIRQRK
jgi:hypothetical protein